MVIQCHCLCPFNGCSVVHGSTECVSYHASSLTWNETVMGDSLIACTCRQHDGRADDRIQSMSICSMVALNGMMMIGALIELIQLEDWMDSFNDIEVGSGSTAW
eukprot:778041_1